MGRPFLQFVTDDSPRMVCVSCGRDVASCGRIIWEGYMGAQEPAFLMRSTVNLEQAGSPRHEHLSTGLYTLMDVVCSGCHSPMGWQYLQASHEDQKYKEGATLLRHSMLKKVTS